MIYGNNSGLNELPVNADNDRETDGYTAIDYIRFGLQSWAPEPVIDFPYRAIVRTLNGDYSIQAFGLGGANTTYPISAFITDMVYLKGTRVKVDVKQITVSLSLICESIP